MALAVNQVTGQQGSHVAGTVTSPSITTISGSLIVVVGNNYNDGTTLANGDVTDSKSNTFTLVTGISSGASAPGIGIWYNDAGTRGASHTVTYNPTASSGDSDNIAVIEITGHATGAALDSATFATASDNSSPFAVTAAAAISGNQIAIYGVCIDVGGTGVVAWTQPTGYTNIFNWNDDADLVTCASYKLNETGTPSPAAARAGGAPVGREVFATFKEAGGGGAAYIPPAILITRQAVNRATLN